jgi:hypothetical protein
MHEESFIESCRRHVEEQYQVIQNETWTGEFGTILCHEIHNGGADGGGLHFMALAAKWGIPVSILGELIWDHCKRLEPLVQVKHA